MRLAATTVVVALAVSALSGDHAAIAQQGQARALSTRPTSFPHRIWAACDFEGVTPDYGWFGRAETADIPRYPGNTTALAATAGPYQNVAAVMTGINPVPGPRMGNENQLFLRYRIEGGSDAIFQHFNLTREDNWNVHVSGLAERRWSELTVNFTRDARRNDGSAERFGDGDRMDDFKIMAGQPANAAGYRLLIDDVMFFANDPALPPEPEPFPNRVIFLAAFDTGGKERYWPGDFELAETPPVGAFWRAARAVPRGNTTNKGVSLVIDPPRPVGARTKLRFRYHLTGASAMTVQVFDLTAQDNRHVNVTSLRQGEWTTRYVDLTRDSVRNDGSGAPFEVGHKVDALFFFVTPDGRQPVELYIDEVVLFDAGDATAGLK